MLNGMLLNMFHLRHTFCKTITKNMYRGIGKLVHGLSYNGRSHPLSWWVHRVRSSIASRSMNTRLFLWDTLTNSLIGWYADEPELLYHYFILYKYNKEWAVDSLVAATMPDNSLLHAQPVMEGEALEMAMRRLFHDGIERMWHEFEENKAKEERDTQAQAS